MISMRPISHYLKLIRLFWQVSAVAIAERRWARGLVLSLTILSLMLVAVHPLTFGTLPDSPDGLLHLYRLIGLDHAIKGGDLWPRYAPGLAFGFGLPIFNYYAPLYLYPFEILHGIGFEFVDALLIGLILFSLIGAVGAYLLGHIWSGTYRPMTALVAGLGTSVAYAYAPYTFYNSPRRGAVAEYVALAILPWVLWAFWRLSEHGSRKRFVVAVVSFALLIPMHNITTLASAGLLVVFCWFLWWRRGDHRGTDAPQAFIRLLLAGVFAIGLMTFFWLPAIAETNFAQIKEATASVGDIQVENNFHTLAETFSLPRPADLTEIHPPVPRPLGWPQLLLAITAFSLMLFFGRYAKGLWPSKGWLGLTVLLFTLFTLLTFPVSNWIYQTLPFLGYTQFPWRMLGPASLLLAVLAGAGVAGVSVRIGHPWLRGAWVGGVLAIMVIYALPWLYGVYIPRPEADSIVDAQNFERETGWVGTASFSEYLPYWTDELPPFDRLTGLYAQSDVIPRLQPIDGVTTTGGSWYMLGAVLNVRADRPSKLTFDWLYFPGFWAEVNGQRVPLTITHPNGYFSFDVPQGESTVVIGFAPTPLRFWSVIVSALFLLGIAPLLVFPKHLWATSEKPVYPVADPQAMGAVVVVALLVGLALFGSKVRFFDNANTIVKRARFASGVESGVEIPVLATFENQVILLGYSGDGRVRSADDAHYKLYWQLANDTVEESYASIIFLRDLAGNIISQTGHQHVGEWPVWAWIPGFYVEERITLDVPPATAPGEYEIHAALYDVNNSRNLDVANREGQPLGVSVQIGTLTVERPVVKPRLPQLGVDNPLDERLANEILLVSNAALPDELEVGQPFVTRFLLSANSSPVNDYDLHLLWIDQGGDVVATSSKVEAVTGYPTTEWRRHDIWRGLHVFTVPGRLSAGEYEVAVQALDVNGDAADDPVVIGKITVTTPERTFDRPNRVDVITEVEWENRIELIGFDLGSDVVQRGDGVRLTLYWQPHDDILRSLTTFVHLVDSQGNIVGQSDTLPANGERPTTGWAPGEVITDEISVFVGTDVPPGDYRLHVGWYDASTGERITVDGSEFFTLAGVIETE